jgi:hypothetical protein
LFPSSLRIDAPGVILVTSIVAPAQPLRVLLLFPRVRCYGEGFFPIWFEQETISPSNTKARALFSEAQAEDAPGC